jgi:predicted Rossmann-fold nucleotide-binding protein
MKLSVIGSNTIQDEEAVARILNKVIYHQNTIKVNVILGGGGKGLPMIVKNFCKKEKIDFVEFLPYFLLDNKVDFSNKYFFIRNKQLVDNADVILFLYNGDCKDVEYAIRYAQMKDKQITVIKLPKIEANAQEE